jgi:hypothetical protein
VLANARARHKSVASTWLPNSGHIVFLDSKSVVAWAGGEPPSAKQRDAKRKNLGHSIFFICL